MVFDLIVMSSKVFLSDYYVGSSPFLILFQVWYSSFFSLSNENLLGVTPIWNREFSMIWEIDKENWFSEIWENDQKEKILSRTRKRIILLCRYLDIYVGKPSIEQDYMVERITPQQCRLRDITYSLILLRWFWRMKRILHMYFLFLARCIGKFSCICGK